MIAIQINVEGDNVDEVVRNLNTIANYLKFVKMSNLNSDGVARPMVKGDTKIGSMQIEADEAGKREMYVRPGLWKELNHPDVVRQA